MFGISTLGERNQRVEGPRSRAGWHGCGPLKNPKQKKTLPFSSASASSWWAVEVHRSIQINAEISQQWTCFWEANRIQRWPWSYTVIPTLPTHPPSSNPKLSSRDASAQLIETQEAFILPLLLSLHLPLFLSFTCTLPFSFCLFILLTQPPSPHYPPLLYFFFPLSELPFFNLSAYSFLFFSAWLFAPNELNSVYSQGRVNCDVVLKCSPSKESHKWPKQSAAVGFKCMCGITTSMFLVPLTPAVFSHYLMSLMPLSFLLLFPHL